MNASLIIDCDPGIDDAVAILLALASPELDVRAILAVAGNAPVERTHENARMLCELAARTEIAVYAGCAQPMQRPLLTGEDMHGTSGLGDLVLPEPTTRAPTAHAVDFLVEALTCADDHGITLAALGPLTNVATALAVAPRLARKIREVIMMGGAWRERGNVTRWAEYNVYADPDAAALVLRSGVHVTMLPLDVTHMAVTTAARLNQFAGLHTRCGDAVSTMLRFFTCRGEERFGADTAPLHDPCVIAYLLRPELFFSRMRSVAVDTNDTESRGRTLIGRPGQGVATAQLVVGMDVAGFFELVMERLSRLP